MTNTPFSILQKEHIDLLNEQDNIRSKLTTEQCICRDQLETINEMAMSYSELNIEFQGLQASNETLLKRLTHTQHSFNELQKCYIELSNELKAPRPNTPNNQPPNTKEQIKEAELNYRHGYDAAKAEYADIHNRSVFDD